MIVLWILLALVIVFVVVPFFLPRRYSVSISESFACPPAAAFRNVSDLNKYREWNPWQKMEPDAKQTVSGEPGAIGHSYAWEGKKIGAGTLTLRKSVPDQSEQPGGAPKVLGVEFDLQFLKPWKARADDVWTFAPEGSGTRVTWSNSGELPHPMRLMLPILNRSLKKQFAEGLRNLKALSERA